MVTSDCKWQFCLNIKWSTQRGPFLHQFMLKICLRSWRKIPKSDTSQKFHCYLNYIFSTMSDESTQQHSGRADLLLCSLLCLPDSRPEGQSIKCWCNSVRYCAASLSFIWPSKLLKCAHVFRPMAIYFLPVNQWMLAGWMWFSKLLAHI